MTDAKQQWAEFLHPPTLRDKLMSLSLYITCYEMMKDRIISNVRDFFLTGFNEDGLVYDEDEWNKVLDLDPHRNTLEAVLAWYRDMGAITDADIRELERLKQLRDELAHKPQEYISGSRELPVNDRFVSLVTLFRKIEVWWVMNVEIATDPDAVHEDIKEENITPGPMITIQLILEIALGNEEEANYYYKYFMENWESM